MRKQQWRLGHAPCPLPSPLPHPPPPPRPPATTPQPMGEQQAPHLTRAMADERWRTVSWRMNKNLCLRRPVSEPGPLRMRDYELCVAARYGCTCGAGRPALSAISCSFLALRLRCCYLVETALSAISCSFLALRLRCCYLVETAYNMLYAYCNTIFLSVRVRLRCCYLVETAYNIMVTASEAAKKKKKVCQAIQDLNPGPAEQLSRVGEHNLVTAHGDRADTAVHSNDYNYACVYQTILLCNIVTKRMKLHNTHVDTYVNPTPDRVWDCPGAYTPRLRHHMVHKVGPEILVVTLRTTYCLPPFLGGIHLPVLTSIVCLYMASHCRQKEQKHIADRDVKIAGRRGRCRNNTRVDDRTTFIKSVLITYISKS
ncbi:hypothetical protein J6590_097160 [Homalodisca vitripennis]|nr:hypothetical protein J6590_097160 [Homalodisca vitripennis]